MKDFIRYQKPISITAAVILFAAIIPFPYFYYQILRIAVTGAAIFNVYLAHKQKKTEWVWIMVIAAVLFNPLFPIFLFRVIWIPIDIIGGIIFLKSIKKLK